MTRNYITFLYVSILESRKNVIVEPPLSVPYLISIYIERNGNQVRNDIKTVHIYFINTYIVILMHIVLYRVDLTNHLRFQSE